jgi:FkbM family methyltransferase
LTGFSLFGTLLIAIAVLAIGAFVGVRLASLNRRAVRPPATARVDGMRENPIAVAPPYQLVRARHGWMLANPNDFYIGKAILEYGEYGELEGRLLAALLPVRPGKVVEIGANIGCHSVALARALAIDRRELVVFEPQPFLFQNLCANLALNGLGNVTALPFACGAHAGTVYFSPPDYMVQGNFGGVSMAEAAQPGSVAVSGVRVDDILGTDAVSLLKVDVEGNELGALQGATRVLSTSRPLLYVENDRVEKSRALIEWLWSQNYRLFWHCPRLFNPDNFFEREQNIYGKAGSLNMLGVPRELENPVEGLEEITSAAQHPTMKVPGIAPSADR